MSELIRAGIVNVIKEEDIYECIACGKMYTKDALFDHEDRCEKIPAFLELLAEKEKEEKEEDNE